MKKTVKLWLALALMVLTGATQAWAAAPQNSYNISFKGTWSTTNVVAVSTIDDIIDDGAAYVKEIPAAQVKRVYSAQGLQIGNEMGGGMLNMVLAAPLKPTKITFQAKQFSDDEKTITVNGKKFLLNGEAWGDSVKNEDGSLNYYAANYEIALDGKTEVSAIKIETDARAYIQNVQVVYDVTKLYLVKYDRNTGKYDLANTTEMTWNDEDKQFEFSYVCDGKPETYFYFTLSDLPAFAYDDDSYNTALNTFNNHRWNANGNRNLVWYSNLTLYKNYTRYFYITQKGAYKITVNQDVTQLNSTFVDPVLTINYPANGSDLAEVVEKAIEAKKEANEDFVLSDIMINLNYQGNYTISKTIEAPANFTISGTATIDASELDGPFVTLSATPAVAKNEWDAYPIDNVTFNYVTIENLKQDLVKSLGNYLVTNLQVSRSIISYSKDKAEKISIFNFSGGSHGNVRRLDISNSTLYAPDGAKWQNGGLFSSQSSKDIRELDKSTDDDGNLTATQTISISNSTLYNVANGKTVSTPRKNSQDYMFFTVQNNIIVNCGKSGQFLKGLNNGQAGKEFKDKNDDKIWNWRVYNNTFMFDGAIVAEQQVGGNDENIQNSYETAVEFADAANGDLTLKGESAQKYTFKGDYRWCKNDVDENGKVYDVIIGEDPQNTYSSYNARYINANGDNVYNAKEGASITAIFNGNADYEVTSVTAVPYYNTYDAQAPKRAPGIMQSIKAFKISATQWAFYMPKANVKLDVTYGAIIKTDWVTVGEVEPITSDFEGEVKPEIIVEDLLAGQLQDEDNNPLWKDEDKTEPLYKVLKEGTDYTVEFADNTKPGEASYTITGIGDYAGTVEGTFDIQLAVKTDDEVKGEFVVEVTDEKKKECEIIEINPATDEAEFTIPAEVDGYTIVKIQDGALQNAGDITDIYLPATGKDGEGIIEIEENALLPVGFTHPKDMINVHVPVQVLDDYANEAGLKKFAKYSHLMAEVTIPESGYATFSTGIKVQFDNDVEVSIVKEYSAEAVKKEVVKNNMVDAGIGVLLHGEAGEHTVYAIDPNTEIATVNGNLLEAVVDARHYPVNAADAAANSYFVLKDGKFYAVADNTNKVASAKAILKVAKTEAAAAALVLDIFDGNTTGIKAINAANLKDAQLYDLNGRKVSNAQKGVYILNGKKVVIK